MDKERIKKIALIGTSCVGKTTIFELLKEKYKNNSKVGFVPEAARAFFEANPDVVRFTTETQARIQEWVIQSEKQAKGVDVLICDRSCVDPIAYALASGDKMGASLLMDNVSGWVKTYTRLILLNPEGVPYKTDSIRDEDENYRNAVHSAFIHILETNKIPYIEARGSAKDRLLLIENLINL